MRELTLNEREIKLAVKNALRYVPEELHKDLAPEFMEEHFDKGTHLRLPLYAQGENLRKCPLTSIRETASKEKRSRL